MTQSDLSILIPAAGASKRLGKVKQLLEYQGRTLLQNAVDLAHAIVPREIIVVTGVHQNAVTASIQKPEVTWVHNPDWSHGVGGSIARGAGAISQESSGLMILLCDQWCLQKQDLLALLETWNHNRQRIVAAKAQGHFMPPVIFPVSCFAQLRNLKGEQGARSLLHAQPGLLTLVPVENAVFDLDTQAHLEKLETSS